MDAARMSTILIVGGGTDPEAKRVAKEIRLRGGSVLRCDTAAFPQETLLTLADGHIRLRRRKLPTLKSVYLRSLNCHPLTPQLEHDLTKRPRGLFAEYNEKRAMLVSVLLHLQRKGVPLVNDFEANAQHSQKPYQLARLHRKRLPIPRFLATNDAKAVAEFVAEVGRAVYKPLAGGATVREVARKDLTEERLSALTTAPVLFQELIEGVSVRAYVVGDHVVAAAEIHSPELDYRRQEDEVVATSLKPEERHAVVYAAQACGMPFAGVDLIRSARGFAILECNPSPMFANFEKKTGQDVARPLAALLTGSTKYTL
jgi:glutathione synthase/RimK-type ligase-like ATP-grasp enzyme